MFRLNTQQISLSKKKKILNTNKEGITMPVSETKKATQAEVKLQKMVVNKEHPLDNLNWFQILRFRYLQPVYEYLGAGLEFKPEKNFRIPKHLRCQEGLKRAERIVEGEGRLLWRIIKEFKNEFFMRFLRMLLLSVLEIWKIILSKNLVDTLQEYVSRTSQLEPQLLNQENLNSSSTVAETSFTSALTLVTGFFLIEIIIILVGKIGWISDEVFLKKALVSLETLFFEQKLAVKFNDIHAKRFKISAEGPTWKVIKSIFELMDSFKAATKSIFMLVYGFSLFGPKFGILITGVALGSLYRYKIQKVYSLHDRENDSISIQGSSVLNSVLDNLQYIKIYTLENFYYKKHQAQKEILRARQARMNFKRILNDSIFNFINLASKCLFFGAFLLDNGVLTAGFIKTFMDLDHYILGQEGLARIFGSFWEIISAKERKLSMVFDEIKTLKTMEKDNLLIDQNNEDLVIGSCLLKGNFYWNLSDEKERGFINFKEQNFDVKSNEDLRSESSRVDSSGRKVGFELRNLDFRVKKGSLTMIVGKIGSGKSSLIQALLGEMNTESSEEKPKAVRKLKGSLAYIGQKPWIMNTTVKENILLGREYNHEFINKCLRYSALEEDISHWERGLDQIVGKKGVALSGGQKARLALARCLYQDADIYLIDDVTSALDVHVGGMVFNKTIKEYLKNKTVIMVTHNIQFLRDADFIYYMDKGKISAKGTFDDIKGTKLFNALKKQREILKSKSQKAKKIAKPEWENKLQKENKSQKKDKNRRKN